jgi:SAM-dependent methyltransferase
MNKRIFLLLFSVLFLLVSTTGCKNDSHDASQESETVTSVRQDDSEFNNEAEQYESADRVIWQKPDLVVDQLGDVDGKVVADLGAGTGYFSRRIAYKGAKVIAIDIDPNAIQWMEEQKARFPIELRDRLIIRKAEPDNPNLKDDEVDIVLLVNTYSYIQNRVPYFTRLRNAIRPAGKIIIIDFKKKKTPFGPALEERIDYSIIINELSEAGYKITKVDETSLEYQYIVSAQSD